MGWTKVLRRIAALSIGAGWLVVVSASVAGAQSTDTYEGTVTQTNEAPDFPADYTGDRGTVANQPASPPEPATAIASCDESGCTFESGPLISTPPAQTLAFGEAVELDDAFENEPDSCGLQPPPTTLTLTGTPEEITLAQERPAYFLQASTCTRWGIGFTQTFVAQRRESSEAPVGSGDPGAPTAEEAGQPGVSSDEVAALTTRQRSSIVAVARGERSVVPASVATPAEAARGTERTVVNLALAGLAVLLLVFPSQLFNATWSQHHGRIERWTARRLGRSGPAPDAVPRHRLGLYALTVLAGAVLAGFLDPNLAFDAPSLTLIGGALISIAAGSLLLGAAALLYRRRRSLSTSRVIDAIPSGLVVAAICVVISRAVGFRPGYLFGLVGGLVFVHALDRAEEGRAELLATIVGLAVAMVAWLATIPIGAAANDGDPNLVLQLADAVSGALFVGGIEGLMIGLIPIAALPGSNLFAWRRLAWVAAEFAVVFIFLQVLLRPESGYLGTSATTSTAVTAALFVAFGLASVAFWGYFRLRPDPAPTPATDHWGDNQEAS